MAMKQNFNRIELTPSQMSAAIEDCILADVVPLILSSPGMGKTSVTHQTVERVNMALTSERASTMDLTDWRGMPKEDKKRGRTIWMPPSFLPGEDDPPTVVFFDEITQTPANCQPPLYQLLLERKLGTTYRAPKSTRWVAAGNLMGDGTFTQKLGSALRDRMIILYMKPDVDDWCRWAYVNQIAPSVIAWIRFKPDALYAFDKSEECSPTSRGWELVSKIVTAGRSKGVVRDALIEGKVGHAHAVEYIAFERVFNSLPSIDAIVLNPDTAMVPDKTKPELAYAVANALSVKSTAGNFDRIVTYLNRLPEEYGVFAVKTATRRDPKLAQVPAFTKWFVTHAEAMN